MRISLVENVTRGLAMMARHFRTTDLEAKALERRLQSIGKLALVGGALAAGGVFGLGLFKKPIEEATEYERKLASLRQMGLGDAQIEDAKKFVEATKIMGTSRMDRLRLFVDAQGSFRQSGMSGAAALSVAKTMTPVLARYEVATAMLSGPQRDAAEGSMRNLNKIVEMMGGLTDTGRAKAIADGVFKAAQSSGRMVDERQLKQFVAYGSSATNQLSLRTIFGGLEPIIGEMGGSTTGVGLRTAYNRVNGMLALMPRRTQQELRRLGLADASGKRQTDGLARLQATDTIAYAQDILKRYQGAGITSRVDIERENAILFGTNGAKIFNKIMSQMPVLLESLNAYDRAKGAEGVTNDPRNKMLRMMIDLEKKESDLKLAIGLVAMPYYIKALEMTLKVLTKINAFAKSDPTAFKGILLLFAAVSAAALVGGGLMLLTAGFRALALVLPVLRFVGPLLSIFVGSLKYLPGLFRVLLGAMGPVGWTIAAIGAAGWLIWNNWKEIKASLIASWNDIKQGFTRLFQGDILGALASFTTVFLRGWQTIFNTIIAGVNTILPSALQMSKFTFADDFAKAHNDTVRPRAAGGNGQQGHVYLDGKKVGDVIGWHISNRLARPSAGGTTFDATRARPAVAGGR